MRHRHATRQPGVAYLIEQKYQLFQWVWSVPQMISGSALDEGNGDWKCASESRSTCQTSRKRTCTPGGKTR